MKDTNIVVKEMSAIKSFDNKSLQENYDIALRSIDEVELSQGNMHDRSHSQFAWKHFVLDQWTNGRNLRQIFAELDKKKRALIDNKFSLLKRLAEANIKEDEIKSEKNEYRRKLLRIEVDEIREQTKAAIRPIQGALKDVITLFDVFKQIKEEMSEEDFEKQEDKYWLMRIIAQSTRDVRERGKIHTGNQEALEQIGLNPLAIELDIIKYIKSELIDLDPSMNKFNGFLSDCAEKYKDIINTSLKVKGIEPTITYNALFREYKDGS